MRAATCRRRIAWSLVWIGLLGSGASGHDAADVAGAGAGAGANAPSGSPRVATAHGAMPDRTALAPKARDAVEHDRFSDRAPHRPRSPR
jgi:hypothetical protein